MARRKPPIIPDELLDQLLAGRDAQAALGKDGLLDELKRALTERALNAEMDHHLDGEMAEGRGNSRNGYGRKTLLTDSGTLPISVPRDRLSTFDPQLIAKYRRRLPGFDDKIVSMYARGMTVREIQGHLAELYGIDVSPDLISAVTDAILYGFLKFLRRCFPNPGTGGDWDGERDGASRLGTGGAQPAQAGPAPGNRQRT